VECELARHVQQGLSPAVIFTVCGFTTDTHVTVFAQGAWMSGVSRSLTCNRGTIEKKGSVKTLFR
jgi:hypothetical protein